MRNVKTHIFSSVSEKVRGDIAEKVASNVNTDLWNKTYALLWRDIAMALSQNVKVEIYNSFCENINKEIKQ